MSEHGEDLGAAAQAAVAPIISSMMNPPSSSSSSSSPSSSLLPIVIGQMSAAPPQYSFTCPFCFTTLTISSSSSNDTTTSVVINDANNTTRKTRTTTTNDMTMPRDRDEQQQHQMDQYQLQQQRQQFENRVMLHRVHCERRVNESYKQQSRLALGFAADEVTMRRNLVQRFLINTNTNTNTRSRPHIDSDCSGVVFPLRQCSFPFLITPLPPPPAVVCRVLDHDYGGSHRGNGIAMNSGSSAAAAGVPKSSSSSSSRSSISTPTPSATATPPPSAELFDSPHGICMLRHSSVMVVSDINENRIKLIDIFDTTGAALLVADDKNKKNAPGGAGHHNLSEPGFQRRSGQRQQQQPEQQYRTDYRLIGSLPVGRHRRHQHQHQQVSGGNYQGSGIRNGSASTAITVTHHTNDYPTTSAVVPSPTASAARLEEAGERERSHEESINKRANRIDNFLIDMYWQIVYSLGGPRGVAVLPNNHIAVSDMRHDRVVILNPTPVLSSYSYSAGAGSKKTNLSSSPPSQTSSSSSTIHTTVTDEDVFVRAIPPPPSLDTFLESIKATSPEEDLITAAAAAANANATQDGSSSSSSPPPAVLLPQLKTAIHRPNRGPGARQFDGPRGMCVVVLEDGEQDEYVNGVDEYRSTSSKSVAHHHDPIPTCWLIVCDTFNDRLQVIDPYTGVFLRSIPPPPPPRVARGGGTGGHQGGPPQQAQRRLLSLPPGGAGMQGGGGGIGISHAQNSIRIARLGSKNDSDERRLRCPRGVVSMKVPTHQTTQPPPQEQEQAELEEAEEEKEEGFLSHTTDDNLRRHHHHLRRRCGSSSSMHRPHRHTGSSRSGQRRPMRTVLLVADTYNQRLQMICPFTGEFLRCIRPYQYIVRFGCVSREEEGSDKEVGLGLREKAVGAPTILSVDDDRNNNSNAVASSESAASASSSTTTAAITASDRHPASAVPVPVPALSTGGVDIPNLLGRVTSLMRQEHAADDADGVPPQEPQEREELVVRAVSTSTAVCATTAAAAAADAKEEANKQREEEKEQTTVSSSFSAPQPQRTTLSASSEQEERESQRIEEEEELIRTPPRRRRLAGTSVPPSPSSSRRMMILPVIQRRPYSLNSPGGLAVLPDNTIAVCDIDTHSVAVIDPISGAVLRVIAGLGGSADETSCWCRNVVCAASSRSNSMLDGATTKTDGTTTTNRVEEVDNELRRMASMLSLPSLSLGGKKAEKEEEEDGRGEDADGGLSPSDLYTYAEPELHVLFRLSRLLNERNRLIEMGRGPPSTSSRRVVCGEEEREKRGDEEDEFTITSTAGGDMPTHDEHHSQNNTYLPSHRREHHAARTMLPSVSSLLIRTLENYVTNQTVRIPVCGLRRVLLSTIETSSIVGSSSHSSSFSASLNSCQQQQQQQQYQYQYQYHNQHQWSTATEAAPTSTTNRTPIISSQASPPPKETALPPPRLLTNPGGIAVVSHQYIAVADYGSKRVVVLDSRQGDGDGYVPFHRDDAGRVMLTAGSSRFAAAAATADPTTTTLVAAATSSTADPPPRDGKNACVKATVDSAEHTPMMGNDVGYIPEDAPFSRESSSAVVADAVLSRSCIAAEPFVHQVLSSVIATSVLPPEATSLVASYLPLMSASSYCRSCGGYDDDGAQTFSRQELNTGGSDDDDDSGSRKRSVLEGLFQCQHDQREHQQQIPRAFLQAHAVLEARTM